MAALTPNITPTRTFEDHEDRVIALAVFRDRDERMVTASYDGMLRLWDLKTGVVLKKMEGHRSRVRSLAVSRDGKWIASGDESGDLIVWHGNTGEPLNQALDKAHDSWIFSLDFSSDSRMLASGSSDTTTKLWNTSTWQVQHRLSCGGPVRCVKYSPRPIGNSQALLAIATHHYGVQIYQIDTSNGYYNVSYSRDCTPPLPFPTQSMRTIGEGSEYTLAWAPDGSRLFSGGDETDPTMREWDASTWRQVGASWKGHFKNIHAISLNSSGTLLASASHDNRVCLWRLSDRRNVAIFKHSGEVNCVTFSADDKRIFSGGVDKKISEWPTSKYALPEDGSQDGLMKELGTYQAESYSKFKVVAMNSTVRNACIAGDWSTAIKVLNLDIDSNANSTAYANRAFVMARKCDWNQALQDAIRVRLIDPS
ncbi:WD40 repeat-like protein [Suillus hirtellus]|nr:WD40 repeat-like protein [Suillus hirtellus]